MAIQGEKKLIRLDWALKGILRQKANFSVLEGFLSELLKRDIKIEEILESESNKEKEEAKFNRVDLLAKTADEERILIEVQCDSEADYLERILFGISKLVIESIAEGEKFKHIKKVYSVNIIFFDLGEGQDYVYKKNNDFIGEHYGDVFQLNKRQEKYYQKIGKSLYKKAGDVFPTIYLLKVNKFDEETKDGLDEWMYFLKTEKIKPGFKAKGLKAASKKLDVYKMEETERRAYERYLYNISLEKSMMDTARFEGEMDAQDKIEVAEKKIAEKEQELAAERKRAEEEKKRAEEKEQQLERTIKNLSKKGLSQAEITAITGVSTDKIAQTLKLVDS